MKVGLTETQKYFVARLDKHVSHRCELMAP